MYPPRKTAPISFDPPRLIQDNFDDPRSIAAWWTISYPSLQSGVGLLANWGVISHANLYLRYFKLDAQPRPDADAAEIEAAKRLFGATPRAERIFFTQSIDHTSPPSLLRDADELAAAVRNWFRVDHYNGDRLQLTVSVSEPCWLTFVDNWDPNWTAKINGRPATIALAMGTYKAVRLPAGASELIFTYEPPLLPWLRKN
jgi:hypothetical protein